MQDAPSMLCELICIPANKSFSYLAFHHDCIEQFVPTDRTGNFCKLPPKLRQKTWPPAYRNYPSSDNFDRFKFEENEIEYWISAVSISKRKIFQMLKKPLLYKLLYSALNRSERIPYLKDDVGVSAVYWPIQSFSACEVFIKVLCGMPQW